MTSRLDSKSMQLFLLFACYFRPTVSRVALSSNAGDLVAALCQQKILHRKNGRVQFDLLPRRGGLGAHNSMLKRSTTMTLVAGSLVILLWFSGARATFAPAAAAVPVNKSTPAPVFLTLPPQTAFVSSPGPTFLAGATVAQISGCGTGLPHVDTEELG